MRWRCANGHRGTEGRGQTCVTAGVGSATAEARAQECLQHAAADSVMAEAVVACGQQHGAPPRDGHAQGATGHGSSPRRVPARAPARSAGLSRRQQTCAEADPGRQARGSSSVSTNEAALSVRLATHRSPWSGGGGGEVTFTDAARVCPRASPRPWPHARPTDHLPVSATPRFRLLPHNLQCLLCGASVSIRNQVRELGHVTVRPTARARGWPGGEVDPAPRVRPRWDGMAQRQ